MDKRANLRWAILLSALCATVGAIFYPVDEQTGPTMTKYPAASAAIKPGGQIIPKDSRRPVWIASDEDPFATRVWQAPQPAEVARLVQPVELAPSGPVPEQPPPPLPYRFLGQMQDGGNRVFYLGHGDQMLLAHEGEVLEGSYKVVSVTDSAIEFESVQSGVKQTLPISGQ